MTTPTPSTRRRVAALAALLAIALLAPLVGRDPDAQTTVPSICYPVEGRDRYGSENVPGYTTYWSDTFGAPRSGHTHAGQDLMSTGGIKHPRRLLSTVDGLVAEIVYNNAGGNRVVIFGDDGWYYVYIHVNNDSPGTDDAQATYEQAFAPGLAMGQRVEAGQFIAYIGDSGNAEGAGAHNHFETHAPLRPGQRYYDNPSNRYAWNYADVVNPRDALRAAAHCDLDEEPDNRWEPFLNVGELVDRQFRDFYSRTPSTAERNNWIGRLNSGADTPAAFIDSMLRTPEFADYVAPVVRLYKAYFNRRPDSAGLFYWIGRLRAGAPLDDVSQSFANSAEFQQSYGSLDNGQFVDLVYQNVLGRAPDEGGRAYWAGELDSGRLNRGQVMTGFSESAEYVTSTEAWTSIQLLYVGMLNRGADAAGFQYWMGYWEQNGSAVPLIQAFLDSGEYAARIAALRTA